MSSEGHVYLLRGGDYLKIGFSKKPFKRLRELQTSCPFPLVLVKSFCGPSLLERALHNKFRKYRLEGEWFSASDEILNWFASVNEEELEALRASYRDDRNVKIMIRVTPEEYKNMHDSAKSRGKTLSDDIRSIFGLPETKAADGVEIA